MKGRFSTGMLALFFGTFGAQKFYLGHKKEGVLCLVLSWTGIPTFLGIFEGIWILSRTTAQWEEYLKTFDNPKWYLEPSILKMYLYPIGLSAFVFSTAQNGHPLFRFAGLLLLLAIWLYPAKNEGILENRLTKAKSYPGRIIASIVVVIITVSAIVQGGIKAPNVRILSELNTTQTGGLYEVRIEAVPTTKVLIGSKEAESLGNNIYKTTIDIKNRANKVLVHAENRGKITEQEITITRAPNDEELVIIEKNKQESEAQRIALEKTKAEELQKQQEELKKQQAEEAKCMKDPKCRKQKETAEKQALADAWIKDTHNRVSSWSVCKNIVQSQLKAPSTADFPWSDYKAGAIEGFIYVTSYVDAQNGFGAQIRTNFTCKFELKNGDINLVDLKTK